MPKKKYERKNIPERLGGAMGESAEFFSEVGGEFREGAKEVGQEVGEGAGEVTRELKGEQEKKK